MSGSLDRLDPRAERPNPASVHPKLTVFDIFVGTGEEPRLGALVIAGGGRWAGVQSIPAGLLRDVC
ncbi:MAG: hypothetical protein OXC62_17095 [Aestuariivita sp.]|nr:hypothetical protein [Aestuariivita sp.]